MAASMIVPLLPLHVENLGFSPSVVGLFGSIYGATQLFSSPWIGHLGDRDGRISVLLRCLFLSSAVYLSSSFFNNEIFFLLIARVLLGMFKHTQDLCRNCLADAALASKRTKVIGFFNSLSSIGVIIGPSISGLISNKVGLDKTIPICFVLCGCLFALNFCIVRLAHWLNPKARQDVEDDVITATHDDYDVINATHDGNSSDKNLGGFFQELRKINWNVHASLLLSRLLLSFAVILYRSSFVLGLKHFYPDMSSAWISVLISYNGFVGFIVGFSVSSLFDHKYYAGNEEKLQMHAIVFVVVGLLLVTLAPSIPFLMVSLVVLTIGTATSRACEVALTTKVARPNEVGKLLGMSSSMVSVARSAGPIMAGLLQEVSFALPAYFATFISIIGLWVFHSKVYCLKRSQE
ncbi:major facilitator superfamily domain-containing protein 9-like isoform X2 [Clavelina lepadiformis]